MDTPTLKDFRLASCQATLFTPDEEVSNAKLVKGLLPGWVDLFDAEPISVPAPQGLPREVPRLILESKSGVWRCEIASARINLFWRKPQADAPEQTLTQFFSKATTLLNEYREFLGARVGRIAAVLNRYTQHPTPGLFLARHFCQERWLTGPLNRPGHFELHAHKRFSLADRFLVNSWVRNKTGQLSAGEENKPVVLVEQDLNTLAEETETKTFTKEDLEGFFAAAVTEFDVILRLYYPEENTHAS